jgi:hypothetical protein
LGLTNVLCADTKNHGNTTIKFYKMRVSPQKKLQIATKLLKAILPSVIKYNPGKTTADIAKIAWHQVDELIKIMQNNIKDE